MNHEPIIGLMAPRPIYEAENSMVMPKRKLP